jgi:hypothetical protein
MTPAMVAALRESLKDACSLEDVTERMEKHMSKGACEEVLFMMFQICKVRKNRGSRVQTLRLWHITFLLLWPTVHANFALLEI